MQKTHQSTSKPLLATIRSGIDSVCKGSMMPNVGLMALEAIPAVGQWRKQLRVSCNNIGQDKLNVQNMTMRREKIFETMNMKAKGEKGG